MKTIRMYVISVLLLSSYLVSAQDGADLKAEVYKWEEKFKSIAYQTEFAHINGNASISYAWDGPTRVMKITNNSTGNGTPKIVYTIPLFQNAASVLTLTNVPGSTNRVYLNSVKQIKREQTSYIRSSSGSGYDAQPVVTTYMTKEEFKFVFKPAPNGLNDANTVLYNLCKAALNYYMWANGRG